MSESRRHAGDNAHPQSKTPSVNPSRSETSVRIEIRRRTAPESEARPKGSHREAIPESFVLNPCGFNPLVGLPSRSDTSTFCLSPCGFDPLVGHLHVYLSMVTSPLLFPLRCPPVFISNSISCYMHATTPLLIEGWGEREVCLGTLNPKREYVGWVGGIRATRECVQYKGDS